MQFIHCFQAEWLKRKNSLASWLVITGGFFTPLILFVVKLVYYDRLKAANLDPQFWQKHWNNSMESMAIMLLPLGIILSVSLITQLEFKNNCWKQWHSTPQRYTTMYFAKIAVIMVMLLEFFLLFNIGTYLSAVLPGLFVAAVPYPVAPIPITMFLKQNLIFFIACLPVVTLQFLAGLQFKNFLVSLGGGIVCWILSIAVLTWKFSYTLPFSYTMLYFLRNTGKFKQQTNLTCWALAYAALFILAGYILYINKKEKG